MGYRTKRGTIQLHVKGVAISLCVMDEQSIGSSHRKAEHCDMSSNRHLDMWLETVHNNNTTTYYYYYYY